MSKLKTLKDFQVEGLSSYTVLQICKEIKQEAIKWVKEEIKEQVFSGISEMNKRWMKRFNITEEDLK